MESIDAFLLACIARRMRGQDNQHSSMLIHVTRYTSVQTEVHRQVEEHIRQTRQRIHRKMDDEQILSRLEQRWKQDFQAKTKLLQSELADRTLTTLPDWKDVEPALAEVLADIEVRMINGTAKDALDYADHAARGLKVIAIGGDKLARGLTLEGLCTSYFLRATQMYDTLMQMGRWFGYRPGYLDLCRLYTTSDLISWFGHIADAAEELRSEFDIMESSGSTPRQYGLKVQSHPVLMVTSPLKMRTARNLQLSFSGQLLETVSLYRDPRILAQNLEAVRQLIRSQSHFSPCTAIDWDGAPVVSCVSGFALRNVMSDDVVAFLAAYQTHPAAHRVNSTMLAEYITSMSAIGELTEWTVAFAGVAAGTRASVLPGLEIGMSKRTANSSIRDRYSIGRLLDPKDELIDLAPAERAAALAATHAAWKQDPARSTSTTPPDKPNGPAIRRIRGFGAEGVPAHPERGLLFIYMLDPSKSSNEGEDSLFEHDCPPVVAFGISFPGSDAGVKVEYKVNNVLWAQEYGGAD